MKHNLGTADRIIRILLAVIIAFLAYTDKIQGTTATILLIVAGVLTLTSFINFCPLYFLFNINTRKK